jgi:hypothetical protein
MTQDDIFVMMSGGEKKDRREEIKRKTDKL